MQIKDFVKDIQVAFPNAEIGRIFFAKQNILLEEQYGFTPGNTRFAEGACCDEINEPEYQLLEHYWGERFKFGGLAGYCHGGKSGLSALSHHVPEVDGKKTCSWSPVRTSDITGTNGEKFRAAVNRKSRLHVDRCRLLFKPDMTS